MTAQVALLNKTAVALATDSAVTIDSSGSKKIYNTVNKLFTLSKYHPIGIMFYGNADFMGTPWETVVKIYRKKLRDKQFKTVKEYSNKFIEFLSSSSDLIEPHQERNYLHQCIGSYFTMIRTEIDEEVKKQLAEKNELNESELKTITGDIIKTHKVDWEKNKNLITSSVSKFKSDFYKKFIRDIRAIKENVFEKLPLNKAQVANLNKIAMLLFIKDRFRKSSSGVVIAGFGEKEIFPAIVHLTVEGKVLNYLKFKLNNDYKVNRDFTASIIPFAQDEMVYTFMEGVHPDYQDNVINAYIYDILKEYPKILIEKISNLTKKEKDSLYNLFKTTSSSVFKNFEEKLDEYRKHHFVDPIVNVVDFLPKEELAAMAESLVNLTSFRRRISMDSETVGGPIDVAVISKGDGFIWIKRKQYFKQDLNQHFLRNYYK